MYSSHRSKPVAVHGKLFAAVVAIVMLSLLPACANPTPPPTPTPPTLAEELIFYDWSDDAIETVFEDFTEEYGVRIKYVTYESQEEALESIRAGDVYDVVVLENQYIPALVDEGQLAEIDYRNVPNFKNISPNFRDLAYDPGNAHSIPYSWGTTGLVVRSDLVQEPVTSWADLWDQRYTGKVAAWLYPRYMLSVALKSLGYSINSEDPDELEAALERLIELKPDATWLEEEASASPLLVRGDVVVALGWAYDVWTGQEENEAISYVLPEEGTILWGDNFVIPANSPNRHTAELFLDFLLRPEITGQIVNVTYYSMANEAAEAFIAPEILSDPVIYPPNEDLENAEIMLPLSSDGEELYAEIWERFMAASQ